MILFNSNLQVLEVRQAHCQMGQQNVLGTEGQRLDLSNRLTARKDNCRSEHSDCSEHAAISHHLRRDILDDSKSQQSILPGIHPDTCCMLECDTDSVDSSDNPLCIAQVSRSGLALDSLNPEPHLISDSNLSSQPESSAKREGNTALQTFKWTSAVLKKTAVEPAAGLGRAYNRENVSGLTVAQSLTLQSETGAWTHDKPPEGMNVTEALKVRFPKVLDCEPKAVQKIKSSDSGLNYSQEAELCEVSLNLEPAAAVETGETGSGLHYLSKSSPEDQSTRASFASDLENRRRARAKLSHQEKTDTLELVRADGSASPELHSVAHRLAGARAAGATFLRVSHVATTDLCHAEEQTMSSVLKPVEGGEAHAKSSSGELVCLANATGATAGARGSAGDEDMNPRVPIESESCQSEAVNSIGQGEQEPISGKKSPLEVSTVEDTQVNLNTTGQASRVLLHACRDLVPFWI